MESTVQVSIALTAGAGETGVALRPRSNQPVTMTLANEGTSICTVQYMASGQLEGEDADDCTDAYSVGAVSYEMITEPIGALG